MNSIKDAHKLQQGSSRAEQES